MTTTFRIDHEIELILTPENDREAFLLKDMAKLGDNGRYFSLVMDKNGHVKIRANEQVGRVVREKDPEVILNA